MRGPRIGWSWIFAPLAAIAGGVFAFRYVPLPALAPIFPATLVALSMIGAAVLVRLARAAPITSPAAFTEEDLGLFFDTLRALALRLFALFVLVVCNLIALLVAIWIADNIRQNPNWDWAFLARYVIAVLTTLSIWITIKLFEMAYGDIGFLSLQREILARAVKRDRMKEAEKKIASPIEPGPAAPYGRALSSLGKKAS
ncbi:MAG TPA: hypothetical protein VGM87_05610 [Roseomonas sp.]|jgi:hypothetical protein